MGFNLVPDQTHDCRSARPTAAIEESHANKGTADVCGSAMQRLENRASSYNVDVDVATDKLVSRGTAGTDAGRGARAANGTKRQSRDK